MDVDIGRDRKRTRNVSRSEVIRERIEDHLMRSGGKLSRERYLSIREDFVRSAVRLSKRAGIRTWKGDDDGHVLRNACTSLATLFGENTVYSRRSKALGGGIVPRTGVNAGWVLDIWEATLDAITREDPLHREEARRAEIAAGDVGGTDEPEAGLKVFNIAHDAPVSVRLIEAYLAKDDETIMRIAVELEHQENGHG